MSPVIDTAEEAVWALPPLILHPFNERVPPSALLENSRAALMLCGLIPSDGTDDEALKRRLLNGRYAELRMLFYLGKDLLRWMDQCVEWAARTLPGASGLVAQSFAGLLIHHPPESVKQKLEGWGVADYVSIFSRAIGLNAVFVDPPAFPALSEEFLRNYHRYADYLFRCYMDTHAPLPAGSCRFELYASGEFSRMLESEWGKEAGDVR
jgi:hypothetical protein